MSIASLKSIFDKSLAYVDLSEDLVQAGEKVGGKEANTETKKPIFCSIVFTVLSIASSKSIFDRSLAYVEFSDDLVQAVEKVGVEEANTKRKK
uniref:Uncharacterized protein n=1 Tax=Romanomermis culicivorax TaxID=13658 RepID=A0A915JE67_ROMCU